MIHVYSYDRQSNKVEKRTVDEIPALLRRPRDDGVLWVDLEQPTDEEIVLLETTFDFHPLAIEDCLHISEYPKIDVFPDYVFMEILGAGLAPLDEGQKEFKVFEVDFFLGPNYLVTFQPEPANSIAVVRHRVETGDIRAISRGADFLLHALVDAMVDTYFLILRHLDAEIEAVERALGARLGEQVLQRLMLLRQNTLFVRRILGPQQGVVRRLSRMPLAQVSEAAHEYFDDVDDHLNIIQSSIEVTRETIAGLLDLHQTRITNHTNNVVRLATVVATLFMPPMLIASIYGMNLRLPGGDLVGNELGGNLSFWVISGLMLLTSLAALAYFRWRRWI